MSYGKLLLVVFCLASFNGCGNTVKQATRDESSEAEFVQTKKQEKYSSDVDALIKRGELNYLFLVKEISGREGEIYAEMLEIDGIEPIAIRDPNKPKNVEHNKKMLVEIEKKFGKGYLEKRKKESKDAWQWIRYGRTKKEIIKPSKVVGQ